MGSKRETRKNKKKTWNYTFRLQANFLLCLQNTSVDVNVTVREVAFTREECDPECTVSSGFHSCLRLFWKRFGDSTQ